MEMISAAKLRRAQARVLAARPYAEKMHQVLADLAAAQAGTQDEELHPLLRRREVQRTAIVHFTPDRGLGGGLAGNVNRMTASFILSRPSPVTLVTVGKKGRDFMVRYGREVRAVFTNLGDYPGVLEITPVSRLISDDYTSGYVDAVYVSYSQFVNVLVQRPVMLQLLPVEPPKIEGNGRPPAIEHIYEPNREEIFNQLLPRFVEVQLYRAILESIACEHAARMVAMRNATDKAREMIDSLTLMLNKARQEAITKDLLDITGGVAALEQG